VLLLEDDASIRAFVRMALDEMAIELVECETVDEAVRAHAQAPARLVLSDLRVPGGSPLDWIERLAADTARPMPAIAVFSGHVDAASLARLRACGVWRVLPKPVPLKALLDGVRDALAEGAAGGAPADAPVAQLPAASASAVDRFFGGDAELHAEYLASCLVHFGHDVRAGDEACGQGDLDALRRLAHSLKTVLETLGLDDAGRRAAALERQMRADGDEGAIALWGRLRRDLLAVAGR
jgi:DNA-binding NarL/FixJ family response regulator